MPRPQDILTQIRFGKRAEITTPTGKELEVFYDEGEFVILDSAGYTQSGDGAHDRLMKILRAKKTECILDTQTLGAENGEQTDENVNGGSDESS